MTEMLLPLTLDDVRAVEQRHSFTFPDEYVRFVLKYNGGRPEPDGFDTGPRNNSIISHFMALKHGESYEDFDANYQTFRKRIPAAFVPIAFDAGGNLILLGVRGDRRGCVYFWDHEREADNPKDVDESNMTRLAATFDEFVEALYDLE